MSQAEYDPGDFIKECVQTIVEANPGTSRDVVFMDVLKAMNMVKDIREQPQYVFVWACPAAWSSVILDMLKKSDGVGVERPCQTIWSEDEEEFTLIFEPTP